MPSYNEIDGVPSHANKWLLRDILRKEMGFNGFMISDYWALWELSYKPDTHGHFVAKDKRESARLAVEAGVNLEAPDPDIYLNLVDLVKKKELKEKQLDELVYPLLYWKFAFGLFEDPYVDPDAADRIVGSTANREPALEAAHASITLLKNENNLAPLNLSKFKTIAVIGPNANRSLIGGYSGVPRYNVTVLDGIKERVGDRAKVLYSEGCKITIGGSWGEDQVVPSNPEEDLQTNRRSSRSRKASRRNRPSHRRQRANLPRSLGAHSHGRPHQPGTDRSPGRISQEPCWRQASQ